ncbi:MAG: hypothetical protein HC795_18865, partial [Coleofasciculaceae cyanobacterium RL_1_1]|nr:hypothetical protein [Coleofasciculaceae cyanobacterium RL_1_1]
MLKDTDGSDIFRGQMVIGRATSDSQTGGAIFHLWKAEGAVFNEANTKITPDNDSVSFLASVSDLLLDPVLLFTKDETKSRGRAASIDPAWADSNFLKDGRILNSSSSRPYIDDFYRADDRFGPNPGYAGRDGLLLSTLGAKTGDEIPGDKPELTQNVAPVGSDPLDLGLDGYWERRAWREGMRAIVGQRLELGGDPLSTVTDLKTIDENKLTDDRPHQSLQR